MFGTSIVAGSPVFVSFVTTAATPNWDIIASVIFTYGQLVCGPSKTTVTGAAAIGAAMSKADRNWLETAEPAWTVPPRSPAARSRTGGKPGSPT